MNTVILRFTVRVLTPVIFALSVYLLLRGHDSPGGGFIAALLAGAAVVLQHYAGGPKGALRTIPLSFSSLVGAGLLLAAGMGVAGLFAGADFLTGGVHKFDVPALGELKVTASLVFDLGVYFVVLAVIVAVVSHLGEEE
jgi:multisubunit Na+/H+ antiporter MnhB subunit